MVTPIELKTFSLKFLVIGHSTKPRPTEVKVPSKLPMITVNFLKNSFSWYNQTIFKKNY